MSVGFPTSKNDIDSRAGTLAVQLRDAFLGVQRFQAFLVATPDATLTAAPYNYTAGEVASMKSAYSDLDQLRTIYEGTATLGSVKDFRTFAKQLTGVV